jgi:hypothetical protein
MVKVENVEQTALLRHYMKFKIIVVWNMSKIYGFAIKMIENVPKNWKNSKFELLCI